MFFLAGGLLGKQPTPPREKKQGRLHEGSLTVLGGSYVLLLKLSTLLSTNMETD